MRKYGQSHSFLGVWGFALCKGGHPNWESKRKPRRPVPNHFASFDIVASMKSHLSLFIITIQFAYSNAAKRKRAR